jgi:hypothetical protein
MVSSVPANQGDSPAFRSLARVSLLTELVDGAWGSNPASTAAVSKLPGNAHVASLQIIIRCRTSIDLRSGAYLVDFAGTSIQAPLRVHSDQPKHSFHTRKARNLAPFIKCGGSRTAEGSRDEPN